MTTTNENRTTAVDPYSALPQLYDLEHAGFDDDVSLYLNFVAAIGDPVLELGCGTGRVLVPLAAAGFRVTGLDLSQPMLDRAAVAVQNSNCVDLVTLHHGAMADCDAALGGPFGIVLVPLNGLMHAATLEEQRAILVAAKRALDPRGQLILDVMNPTPEHLRALEQGVGHEGSWELPNGDVIDKFSSRQVRSSEQRIETEIWYDRTTPAGVLSRVRTRFPMRYLHRAELELLLEATGFAEWEIYGGYELEPYGEGADRLIVTADPTRSNR